MCLSCVCGLLCKIFSFIISLLFIVGIVLLVLWLTGIIFSNRDDNTTTNYESIRSIITAGGGGH